MGAMFNGVWRDMPRRMLRLMLEWAQRLATPLVWSAACLALWATPARAQAPLGQPASSPAQIPAEAFFKNPDVLEAKLSPSGKLLAITTAAGASRVALVVIELAGAFKATRVALFSDVDVVRFHWVNENRLIFSVADLEAGSGEDRRYAPGLFGVNADGNQLRLLVARQGTPFVVDGSRGGREALPWNHWLLHVPQPQPGVDNEEVIVGHLEISGQRNIDAVTPMWLNVVNGRTRSANVRPPKGSIDWLFDSKGEARVAEARIGGKALVHWRAPGQAHWQVISESDLLRSPFEPRHVDDAGNLYVTHRSGPEGYEVLSRFDFERKAPAAEPWISVPGFDFSGTVISEGASRRVAGIRVETDAETTVWLDDTMKGLQKRADDRWPGGVNRMSCRRCGQPDMVMLVHHFSDRHPGQLWLYTAANNRWQGVSPILSGIDPALMASVDFHRIKARDGRDLPVWLTLPAGRKPGSPGPAVVLVHGGPWVRGGHWRWSATEQFLASRGYLVISPEFRGSQGYGQEHFAAGWKQWGRAMQDDVADAVLWAQAQGLADKRVCIAGASYGGYATLMGLVRHPELYRCGVSWVAVTDLFLMLEGSWWVDDDTHDASRRYTLPQMVGDVKADAEMLTSVSPVAQAHRIRAPLLLAFGEADRRVPLAHGKRMREALQKAGNDPQWVTYSNEGHSWRLPQTRTDFAQRMEKFLAEHLK